MVHRRMAHAADLEAQNIALRAQNFDTQATMTLGQEQCVGAQNRRFPVLAALCRSSQWVKKKSPAATVLRRGRESDT